MASSAGAVRAGGAFVEIFAKDGAFYNSMRRVENRIRAVGTAIRSAGSNLFFGGAAVGAPIALAVRQFSALDDSVRASAAAAGRGTAALAGMTAAAERLGLKFGTSSIEVAKLGLGISRAFGDRVTEQELNNVTEAVLTLSKATGVEGTRAADIMAASLSQFGLGAGQAARVADGLTFTANATLNSVEGLGEALSYAGLNAASAGMDFEQTLAVLGTLGNLGIQGSEAGTVLRRLLAISGAEAQKLSEIFGVSFLDAAGNVRPLVDSLDDVSVATQNLSGGERINRMNEAFGLLGITAAIGLGKAGDATRKLETDIRSAAGTSVAQAAFMQDGVGGAMGRLVEAVRQVGNAVGTALAPAIVDVSAKFQSVVETVKAFVGEHPQMVLFLAGTTAGMVALSAVLAPLAITITTVSTVLGGLRVALSLIPVVLSPIGIIGVGVASVLLGILAIVRELSPSFREATNSMLGFGSASSKLTGDKVAADMKKAQEEAAATAKQQAEAAQEKAAADAKAAEAERKKKADEFEVARKNREEAARKEEEQKQLLDRGRQIKAEVATPEEKLQERIAELRKLRDASAIDAETFTRAVEAAKQSAIADLSRNQKEVEQLSGVSSAGAFGTVAGLGIAPELAKLEDPAIETARNTAATVEAIANSALGEKSPLFGAGGAAGGTVAAGAAGELVAQAVGGELAAGGAVGATIAAASVPAAAGQARAGTDAASQVAALGSIMSDGFKALIAEVHAHAQVSREQLGIFKQVRDNLGKVAVGVFQ